MRGAEIAMIVCIVMQIGAMVLALLLVNQTKYRALWWCCIIGLAMLTAERVLQLFEWDGVDISNLAFAWVGTIVSVSFSVSVVCAHMLVRHVDRMTNHRRMLENSLMTAVLRTEERSRASFSRELHDGLGPLLSSAKMSISALQRAELSDKDRSTLANTSAVIDEAIRSLREISNYFVISKGFLPTSCKAFSFSLLIIICSLKSSSSATFSLFTASAIFPPIISLFFQMKLSLRPFRLLE